MMIDLDFPYSRLVPLAQEGPIRLYDALHSQMGERRLVKMLPGPVSSDEIDGHAEALDRLATEARVSKILCADAPVNGVARVLNYGVRADRSTVLARDFLDGETLRARVHLRGPMSVLMALDIAIQIGETLCAVHARRIVHGEVSAANVFLLCNKFGAISGVRLLGFGGATIDSGDVRDDVRGVAATIYETLTGTDPSGFGSIPPLQDGTGASDALVSEVHRALIDDRELRHSSMQEFVDVLREQRAQLDMVDQPSTPAADSNPTAPYGIPVLCRMLDGTAAINDERLQTLQNQSLLRQQMLRASLAVARMRTNSNAQTVEVPIVVPRVACPTVAPTVKAVAEPAALPLVLAEPIVEDVAEPIVEALIVPQVVHAQASPLARVERRDLHPTVIDLHVRRPIRRHARAQDRARVAVAVAAIAAMGVLMFVGGMSVMRRVAPRAAEATHFEMVDTQPIDLVVAQEIVVPAPAAASVIEAPAVAPTASTSKVMRRKRVVAPACPAGLVGCSAEPATQQCPPGLYPPGCLPLLPSGAL